MMDLNIRFDEWETTYPKCKNCEYWTYNSTGEGYCSVFWLLGCRENSHNFCPLTGRMSEDRKLYADFPEGYQGGYQMRIFKVCGLKQGDQLNGDLYTPRLLCEFSESGLTHVESTTSAWVPFDYIKNEEEI